MSLQTIMIQVGFMLAKAIDPNKVYRIKQKFEGYLIFDKEVKFYTRRYIGEDVKLFGKVIEND